MRDSPSITIAQTLIDAGALVTACHPEGTELAKLTMPAVEMAHSSYNAAKDADAIVIVVKWDTFDALDWKKLADAMNGNVPVDLQNIYNPSEVKQTGLKYTSAGSIH
jgi:UDPglucose 6-dehydrogenase